MKRLAGRHYRALLPEGTADQRVRRDQQDELGQDLPQAKLSPVPACHRPGGVRPTAPGQVRLRLRTGHAGTSAC